MLLAALLIVDLAFRADDFRNWNLIVLLASRFFSSGEKAPSA
jgi:hypothetical protein